MEQPGATLPVSGLVQVLVKIPVFESILIVKADSLARFAAVEGSAYESKQEVEAPAPTVYPV